jgi:hypothetical protein
MDEYGAIAPLGILITAALFVGKLLVFGAALTGGRLGAWVSRLPAVPPGRSIVRRPNRSAHRPIGRSLPPYGCRD